MRITEAFCCQAIESQMWKKETQNKQITEEFELATLDLFLSKMLAVRILRFKILPVPYVIAVGIPVKFSVQNSRNCFGLCSSVDILSAIVDFLQHPHHLQLWKAHELMLALSKCGSYSSKVLFTASAQINLSFFLEGSPIS